LVLAAVREWRVWTWPGERAKFRSPAELGTVILRGRPSAGVGSRLPASNWEDVAGIAPPAEAVSSLLRLARLQS
jgi:hypothetical protein